MALPKLPGFDFNKDLGREDYHRRCSFRYYNNLAFNTSYEREQKAKIQNSRLPPGNGQCLPAWLAFDKQVLCFDGYFREDVTERREEQNRVRPVKIYFYLEDDSVQVVEPRLKNSQLPQGTLVKRHRIPKPVPNEDQFYTVDDFNLGLDLVFYGRCITVTNCDEFTQNFMKKCGIRLNEPTSTPCDPYREHRKALDESMAPLRPYEKQDTLRQFLQHDRKVLRFNAVWDDRAAKYGQLHTLELHYFLADDTIEIKEVVGPNSGKDSTPMLLKRGKLPKETVELPKPGEVAPRTVLNVFGAGANTRHILDSLKTGAKDLELYTDRDLKIGAVINVWGRPVLLTDCDLFTQNHYRTKFGVESFVPVNVCGDERPTFATEAEAKCRCRELKMKCPHKLLDRAPYKLEETCTFTPLKSRYDSEMEKRRNLNKYRYIPPPSVFHGNPKCGEMIKVPTCLNAFEDIKPMPACDCVYRYPQRLPEGVCSRALNTFCEGPAPTRLEPPYAAAVQLMKERREARKQKAIESCLTSSETDVDIKNGVRHCIPRCPDFRHNRNCINASDGPLPDCDCMNKCTQPVPCLNEKFHYCDEKCAEDAICPRRIKFSV